MANRSRAHRTDARPTWIDVVPLKELVDAISPTLSEVREKPQAQSLDVITISDSQTTLRLSPFWNFPIFKMTNTSDFKNCLHHIEVGHPDLETPLIASKAQRTFAFINTSKPSITFHM